MSAVESDIAADRQVVPKDVVAKVAQAITDADNSAEFYKIELWRLVDGVSTYRLTYYDEAGHLEFDSYADAYDDVRARKSRMRAAAVIQALSKLALLNVQHVPNGDPDSMAVRPSAGSGDVPKIFSKIGKEFSEEQTRSVPAMADVVLERDAHQQNADENYRRWATANERVKALTEALTPSGGTKAEYNGEFSWEVECAGADGNPAYFKQYVPWTTVKEIMAAIKARAERALPAMQVMPEAVREHLFYFSRCKGPSPFESRWLVSGIIQASDKDAAVRQLDCALAKSHSNSSDFEFCAVADIERISSGLVAITMGGDR